MISSGLVLSQSRYVIEFVDPSWLEQMLHPIVSIFRKLVHLKQHVLAAF